MKGNAEALAELFEKQRERNARIFVLLRVCLGAGALAMQMVGGWVLHRPEFEVWIPILAGYLGTAVAVWVLARRLPKLLAYAFFLLPLVDVPMVFAGQLVAGSVNAPLNVALYTASLFAVLTVLSMLSLRARNVVLTSATSIVLETVLIIRLGGQASDAVACVFSLGAAGGLAVVVMRQIHSQLGFAADLLVTERALNAEVRHQVAERSRSLGETLAQANVALPATSLEPGQSFDARYRVLRRLGVGGMGAVYEVERLTDGRRFALKAVTGNVVGAQAARFAREAEIGARVKHPNLIEIVDVGLSPAGAPYLVMELVSGGTLADRQARFGEIGWATPILQQIAAGLSALHAAGVVHRDLKPANVLLSGDDAQPAAHISDFGISGLWAVADSVDHLGERPRPAPGPRGHSLTLTGAMLGTPLYMPPEAVRGGKAMGPAADVFAFGVVACEVLTGRLPFAAPVVLEVMAGRPMPAAAPLPPEVPPAQADLILRCVREDPEGRPSIAEVVQALGAEPRSRPG